MTRIVKVGGNRADDAGWIREVSAGIAASAVPTVLVHGGGKDVTELQRALGIEPEWHDGLRVTTPRVLEVVRMVLSGGVNKRWVAALLDAGADAVGISGEDGALLRGTVSHGGALGRTGAAELCFVSDVPGVKAGGAWVDELDAQAAAGLLESGEAAGAMRPELRAAMRARAAGVGRVRIGAVEMLNDDRAGTRIEITREAVHAGD